MRLDEFRPCYQVLACSGLISSIVGASHSECHDRAAWAAWAARPAAWNGHKTRLRARFQPGEFEVLTPTPNKDTNYVFAILFVAVGSTPTKISSRAHQTSSVSTPVKTVHASHLMLHPLASQRI